MKLMRWPSPRGAASDFAFTCGIQDMTIRFSGCSTAGICLLDGTFEMGPDRDAA